MRRQLPLVFAFACASAFASMLAQFSNLSAAVTANGLRVSFTASGLPANTSDTFTATADARAVWGCFNRGGQNPNAQNKRTTVSGQVTGNATFTTNANGVVSGAVGLRAPSAGSFSCPNGQDKMLSSVTFSNVRISESANNTSASVPGTFQKVIRPLK
jgi:hypothetical protein